METTSCYYTNRFFIYARTLKCGPEEGVSHPTPLLFVSDMLSRQMLQCWQKCCIEMRQITECLPQLSHHQINNTDAAPINHINITLQGSSFHIQTYNYKYKSTVLQGGVNILMYFHVPFENSWHIHTVSVSFLHLGCSCTLVEDIKSYDRASAHV